MIKDFTNENVYEFLAEECRQDADLWAEFGEGILSHTDDDEFWELLSEQLDCFRICEECGRPMIEGYVVNGCDTYCSDDCLHKHVSPEEYKSSATMVKATPIGRHGMRIRKRFRIVM